MANPRVPDFPPAPAPLGAFSETSGTCCMSPTLARTAMPGETIRLYGEVDQHDQAMAPMVAFTAVCNRPPGVAGEVGALEWSDRVLPIGLPLWHRLGVRRCCIRWRRNSASSPLATDRRPPP